MAKPVASGLGAMAYGLGSGVVVVSLPLADVSPWGWRLVFALSLITVPLVWSGARTSTESHRFLRLHPDRSGPPSGTGDPVQPRVEDEKAQKAKPEDRGRIADQAEDAHDLVGQLALTDGGQHADRDSEDGAEDDGHGRQFQRRGKDAGDIVGDGALGQEALAEIAGKDLLEIHPELFVERLVEAKLHIDAVIDRLRRAVADHGKDRIDGHHPPDEEGHHQKAEKGQRDRGEKFRGLPEKPQEGALAPSVGSRIAHAIWSHGRSCCR